MRDLCSFALILALAAGCATPDQTEQAPPTTAKRVEPADLVLRGGNVITVDDTIGQAEAIAISGDRIRFVGADAEIEAFIDSSTRIIELGGKTVIPGFIEGHGHFTGIGAAAQMLDLMHVRNWDEVTAMVEEAVKRTQPGEWITGRGWHQEKWDRKPANDVEGFPTHHEVSLVSPRNPVRLTHASGHAAFFNKAAMDLAGITANTPDPAGGEILRDESGEAIGVFRETAQGLVSRAAAAREITRSPAERKAARIRTVQLAQEECLRKGVTSFQDAGSPFETIDLLRQLAASHQLKVRLWVMIRDRNSRLARMLPNYRVIGANNHFLTVRAVKRTIDGALGPRGAWLLEPYSDSPESRGLATATVESVTRTAQLAAEHGFQCCVHAIGDRANREVLDIFEETLAAHPEIGKDHRWRIEHAQHIHPDDIPRFGELGVVASMQGVHCTSDAPYVTPRLGEERARTGAYVWQSLMRHGALVTNGTDAPVEDVDPIASYYATVTRRMRNGRQFYPEQCMSRMEALKSYTIWCARAAFEDEIKGSITPGKLADLVVLSQDLTTVPEDEIRDTQIVHTVVGGEVVYSKP